MSSRILVTGAAGVIGFELAKQLVEAGDEVVAVETFIKGGRADLEKLAKEHPKRLTIVERDLARDPKALDGRFDAIYHLAAIVGVKYVTDHPFETVDVNMRSILNVLAHAMQTKSGPFFFASSSENYASGVDLGFVAVPTGENAVLSIDEIQNPRWSYAASKICGEAALFGAAKESGLVPIVVRFHNVYGPRMGPTHVVPEMIERCRKKVDPFPIFGPDQTRSFLYVEDAGRALRTVLGAAVKGAGGIYNIGATLETKIGDLAETIFDVSGFHPKIEVKSAPPGSVQRRVPDTSKLAKLGFAPRVSLLEGIRACWRA